MNEQIAFAFFGGFFLGFVLTTTFFMILMQIWWPNLGIHICDGHIKHEMRLGPPKHEQPVPLTPAKGGTYVTEHKVDLK